MSEVIGNTFVIKEEEPTVCELCGDFAETRPYGPNGENVCFPCGMKNEAAAKEKLRERIKSINRVIMV